MGEHIVPLRKENWSWFDHQRKTFQEMTKTHMKGSGMSKIEDSFAEFDKELERMRNEMFTLKAFDFDNPFDSGAIKPENPIVCDAEGNKRLSLRFDCKEFKPEEISVKTNHNCLMVQAKHVEESPGRKVYREFSRQYTLPRKIDPLALNSSLAADGVLTIEAPAPEAEAAPTLRILPIKQL